MAASEGREDAGGEEVEAPGGFHSGEAHAFDDGNIERDQEDVGHGEFAEESEGGQGFTIQKVEMDQGEAEGFGDGSEECEEEHDERQHDVGLKEAREARDDGDFRETEDREEPCAHQWGEPADGEEDEQSKVEEPEHVLTHRLNWPLRGPCDELLQIGIAAGVHLGDWSGPLDNPIV